MFQDGETVDVRLSEYPHRELLAYDSNGEVTWYLPASAFCFQHGLHVENPDLSNLEVLYVGQAYGDGSRSAFERLKNHSTLQKILATAQYESPESEILLLTFEYLPYKIIINIDGITGAQISDKRDQERFYSIKENHLTEHQQICLAEAGLIRYFQPKYNKIYKNKFPSKDYKVLTACYDLDFSALAVEIDTEDLGFKLFSDRVTARTHHISNIDLVNHEDRWGFFHMTIGDEVKRFPDVIFGS